MIGGASSTTTAANRQGDGNTTTTPPPLHPNFRVHVNPLVTNEKKATASMTADASQRASSNANAASTEIPSKHWHCIFSVTCPDGSIVHLSADKTSSSSSNDKARSHIILGRGKSGIPSSAVQVSRKACVLRLVDQCDSGRESREVVGSSCTSCQKYALELVVLGSTTCRVTRLGCSDSMFVGSISQILANDHDDFSPSSVTIHDGDVIEPYERSNDWSVEEAKKNGLYYPFKVSIDTCNSSSEEERGLRDGNIIDGSAFLEASRKIDLAAKFRDGFQATSTTDVGTQTEMTSLDAADEQNMIIQSLSTQSSEELGGTLANDNAYIKSTTGIETAGPVSGESGMKGVDDYNNLADISSSEMNEKHAYNQLPHEQTKDGLKFIMSANPTHQSMGSFFGNDEVMTDRAKLSEISGSGATTLNSKLSSGTNHSKPDEAPNTHLETAKDTPTREVLSKGEQRDAVKLMGYNVESDEDDEEELEIVPSEELMKNNSTDNLAFGEIANRSTTIMRSAVSSVGDVEEINDCTNPSDAYEQGGLCQDSSKETVSNLLSSPDEESIVDSIAKGDAFYEIKAILGRAKSPGTFAVGGSCNGTLLMPGLVVDGVGKICLPLSQLQATELVRRCEQAPFGRWSKTISGKKSVRNIFQLDPMHFKTTNPNWSEELDLLTKEACMGLGVGSNLTVEAQLYKLLLNEEGSFFEPHRDTEKVDGMFGTLVVVLPSQFTGGELLVKHKGETKAFNQGIASGFGSQYAAFYADCKHELKTVASGNRLCLVYNLVKVGYGSQPRAINKGALVKRLIAAARQWEDEFEDKKIIVMTEHKYTLAGIRNGSGSSKYKGSDASVIDLLDSAIEEGAKLDYDHGRVSFTEHRTDEDNDWHSYYRDRWSDRNLSLTLSSWGHVDIGKESGEIREYFEGQEPDEPTGNEGVIAERKYADADVIVIWPCCQRWKIATNNNTSRMCDYLLKACKVGHPDSEAKEECMKKIESVIPRIQGNTLHLTTLMKCIIKIGDEELGKKLLTSYLNSNQWGKTDTIIAQLQAFERFGADAIKPILLSSINAANFAADPTGMSNFFIKYRNVLVKKASTEELVNCLTESFVNSISPEIKHSPSKSMETFPLDSVLNTFVAGKRSDSGALAKRVLEGYLWFSCQKVQKSSQHSWRTASARQPDGPKQLLTASLSLISLCETFGWEKYKAILVEAVEKLSVCSAVELVEKIAPVAISASGACDRSQVCSRMASIVCERILQRTQTPTSLATYKKLVQIIGRYCPSMATNLFEVVMSLEVDSILYPLVSDRALRCSATNGMKNTLDLLTLHCARILQSRVSAKLGSVSVWTLPNASLSRNSAYSGFLRNPCKQVHDWQVKKSDHKHKGFLQDLSPLIHLGEVKAELYQPRARGPYHFRITKLKPQSVPVTSLGSLLCSCSNGGTSQHESYQRRFQNSSCRLTSHRANLFRLRDDQKKLLVVKALIPMEHRGDLEQSNETEVGPGNRKRSASTTIPTATPISSTATTSGAVNKGAQRQQHRSVHQPPKKKSKSDSTSTISVEVIDLT